MFYPNKIQFGKLIYFHYLCCMNKLPYTRTSDAIKGYSDSLIAKTERADCVVRAIASASGMTYDKAHEFVAETFGRKPRKGTSGFIYGMNRLVTENKKLNRRKVTNVSVKNGSKNMTVNSFIKENTKGSFILNVRGHAFTVRDGVVVGNFSDAIKIRKILKAAWKVGV